MLLALTLVFGLQQCYYDNEEEMYPGIPEPITLTDTVTYQADIKPITDTKCAISGCHAGPNPQVNLNLETYAGVKTVADNGKLEQHVIIDKTMPPTGPLPPSEIQLLKRWLETGALEN